MLAYAAQDNETRCTPTQNSHAFLSRLSTKRASLLPCLALILAFVSVCWRIPHPATIAFCHYSQWSINRQRRVIWSTTVALPSLAHHAHPAPTTSPPPGHDRQDKTKTRQRQRQDKCTVNNKQWNQNKQRKEMKTRNSDKKWNGFWLE